MNRADKDFAYDYLGQRMIKIGEAPTYFAYDIFGNFFAELDLDGDPINTYVYLGKHRLAMLGGTVGGSMGCSMGQKAVDSARANWAIIIILPVIFILALKYRKNKLVVGVLVVIGGSAIILIAMNEAGSTLTYNEAIYFYHNDHLGTPQVMTDADGDVVWDASYEPFGKINSYETQTITNRFRFPGQYQDDMTGMYYNHHRYYMPEVGRYNRVDLMVSYDKSNNYIYAKNGPFIYIDFEGLAEYKGMIASLSAGTRGLGAGIYIGNAWSKCGDDCKYESMSFISIMGGGSRGSPFSFTGSTIHQKDGLLGRGSISNLCGSMYLNNIGGALAIIGRSYGILWMGETESVSGYGRQFGIDASANFFLGYTFKLDITTHRCDNPGTWPMDPQWPI